jgi:hypothetical protein
MSQGNPLYSYFKQTKASLYFSFTKLQGGRGPVWGSCFQWWGNVEKDCRRVNIVHILCTHVCKWKMIPVETIPGIGVEEGKGE